MIVPIPNDKEKANELSSNTIDVTQMVLMSKVMTNMKPAMMPYESRQKRTDDIDKDMSLPMTYPLHDCENGLLLRQSCTTECLLHSKENQCFYTHEEIIQVSLNNSGDYVLLPVLTWYQGYYNEQVDKKC
jgi:hypothetical protein